MFFKESSWFFLVQKSHQMATGHTNGLKEKYSHHSMAQWLLTIAVVPASRQKIPAKLADHTLWWNSFWPHSLMKFFHQKWQKNPLEIIIDLPRRAYGRKLCSETPGPNLQRNTKTHAIKRCFLKNKGDSQRCSFTQSRAKMYVGFFWSLHACPYASLETIPNLVNLVMYARMCRWLPKAVSRKTSYCVSHKSVPHPRGGWIHTWHGQQFFDWQITVQALEVIS